MTDRSKNPDNEPTGWKLVRLATSRFARRRPILISAALLAACMAGPATSEGVDLGWKLVNIAATGSHALRYVPPDLDLEKAAPAVVFLHGSGAMPVHYRNFVAGAADEAGCVLILPKSLDDSGWGHASDPTTISEALRIVASDVTIETAKISIAGHSSGGAYACLLAFTTHSGYAAVFSLSAPFLPIQSVSDPDHKAPIRMYYGTTDPNYIGGAFTAYQAMWHRLGVPMESEILSGYGHNTWPDSVMENGFLFLVRHRAPTPPRRWRRAPIRRIGP